MGGSCLSVSGCDFGAPDEMRQIGMRSVLNPNSRWNGRYSVFPVYLAASAPPALN